jgi:mRNA-degrading endonuclease toxin of MazEF toxin-antitoxin module
MVLNQMLARCARYAVVVQAEEFLDLSTTLVAPTSTAARAASFRPGAISVPLATPPPPRC